MTARSYIRRLKELGASQTFLDCLAQDNIDDSSLPTLSFLYFTKWLGPTYCSGDDWYAWWGYLHEIGKSDQVPDVSAREIEEVAPGFNRLDVNHHWSDPTGEVLFWMEEHVMNREPSVEPAIAEQKPPIERMKARSDIRRSPLVVHGEEVEEELREYLGKSWLDGSTLLRLISIGTYELEVKDEKAESGIRLETHVIGCYFDVQKYGAAEFVPYGKIEWSTAKEVLSWIKDCNSTEPEDLNDSDEAWGDIHSSPLNKKTGDSDEEWSGIISLAKHYLALSAQYLVIGFSEEKERQRGYHDRYKGSALLLLLCVIWFTFRCTWITSTTRDTRPAGSCDHVGIEIAHGND